MVLCYHYKWRPRDLLDLTNAELNAAIEVLNEVLEAGGGGE